MAIFLLLRILCFLGRNHALQYIALYVKLTAFYVWNKKGSLLSFIRGDKRESLLLAAFQYHEWGQVIQNWVWWALIIIYIMEFFILFVLIYNCKENKTKAIDISAVKYFSKVDLTVWHFCLQCVQVFQAYLFN